MSWKRLALYSTFYASAMQALLGCSVPTATEENADPGSESPTLTLTISTDTKNFANLQNYTSFTIQGTCGNDDEVISITSVKFSETFTTACSNKSWSKVIDLTSISDGFIGLNVESTNSLAQKSEALYFRLTKDIVAPQTPALVLNAGQSLTKNLVVPLTLSGDLPYMMTISQTACSEQSPESFVSTKLITLALPDQSNTVYVKYVDSAGNFSGCSQASIQHDGTAPMLGFSSPAAGSPILTNQLSNFTVTGTCSENGRPVQFSMDGAGTADCVSGQWTKVFDLSGKPDGAINIAASQTDLAGNTSIPLVRTFSKSTSSLNLTIASPTEGTIINSTSAATVTITGSCSSDNNPIELSGAIIASTNCLSGSYSFNIDKTSLSEGTLNFQLVHTDQYGNSSATLNLSLIKDTQAPTAASISISSGATHTNSLATTISLSALDAAAVFVSNSILCDVGVWEPMTAGRLWDLTLENDINFVYAKFKDTSGNETSCISDSVIHDNIAPTASWQTPAEGSLINSLNQTQFEVTGLCSEDTQSIEIKKGTLLGTAICTNNTWTSQLDLSSLGQGTQELQLFHRDLAGNTSTAATRTFIKDSVGPSNSSITINSGDLYTSQTLVTLSLSATDAVEMYITDDPTCENGSAWEAFNTTYSFTLLNQNTENEIFVVFKDANDNKSSCVSNSITHDSLPPTWSSAPTHASINGSTTQSPLVNYFEDASDLGSGVQYYQYAIGTGTSGVNVDNVKSWTTVTGGSFTATGLSLIDGGTYFVNMRVFDNLGASSTLSSTGWIVDITAPIVTISTPVNNLITTQSEIALSGSCETGYPVEITYGSDVAGDSTASCNAGQYKTYIQMSGPTGERSITVSQTDLAANRTSVSTTISRFFNRSEFNGQILSMKKLSDGSTLVGGQFNAFSTTKENYLAHVDLNTSRLIEKNLGDAFNGVVQALVELPDGSLIVGGSFTQYRGRTANRIAKVNANGTLDHDFNPETGANGFDGAVLAIELSGSDLYVGGSFTRYRGVTTNRIAKISTSGTLNSTFSPSTNGFNSTVRSIRMTASGLYVGGDFTSYKGSSTPYIAKLSDQGTLDTTFNPASGANGTNARVRAIVSDGTSLFLGGDFTTYRGSVANRIAKINISTNALDSTFNPASGGNGTAGAVYALAINASDLYAGGSFTTYRGSTVNNIAKVNAGTGALTTAFSTGGTIGVNAAVNSIALYGSSVYLGGSFVTARGSNAFRVAKLNSSNGAIDTTFSPGSTPNGANAAVNALIATSSGLWVGGSFSNISSGIPVHNFARIDSSGNLDEDFSVRASIVNTNNVVRSIAVSSDESFAILGGDFTQYRGAPANRIAKINLTTSDLDSTFSPSSGGNGFSSGAVYALKISGDDASVYAGGTFTNYRGGAANRIAKIDSASGSLNTTFNPSSGSNGAGGSNTAVLAIEIDNTHLYLGGSFTTYRGSTVNRIVRTDFNGLRDTTFNPASGTIGFGGTVNSLWLDDTDIYAGGVFTTYRGTAVNRLAKLSKSAGTLNTTFSGTGANSTINKIEGNSTHLFVGGSLTTWKGLAANYIVKINKADGSKDLTFNPASGANGTNGTINVLFLDGSEVVSGGNFSSYRNTRHFYYFKSDTSGNIVFE